VRRLERALIVDDNRIFRVVLREVLENAGVEVVEAADGDAALRALAEGPFDLVILDLLMPQRDGFSAATRLKELRLEPRPVLFVTTAVYKGSRWRHEVLTTYGADEFLVKPVDPEELLGLLRRYFELPADG